MAPSKLPFKIGVILALGAAFIAAPAGAAAPVDLEVYALTDTAAAAWPLPEARPEARPESLAGRPLAFLAALRVPSPPASWALALEEGAGGRPVEAVFQPLAEPLAAYALMIDNSISMWPEWEEAKAALKLTFDALPAGSPVGVYSFADDLRVWRPLGRGPGPDADLAETIDGLSVATTSRNTLIYGALQKAFAELAAQPAAGRDVFIFSDGGAEDTAMSPGEIIGEAKSKRIAIQAVSFRGSPNRRTPPRRDSRDLAVLERLTRETGGTLVIYRDQEQLAEEMGRVLKRGLLAGLIEVRRREDLPFGLDRLKVVLTLTDEDGRKSRWERAVPLDGTRGWGNFMTSLGRTLGVRDPRLALGGAGAVVILGLAALAVRRRRRLRLALAVRVRAEEEARQRWENQSQKLAWMAEKLERFEPRDKVLPSGRPYGWLIDERGRAYDLSAYSTRIGRAPENDVALPDDYVSNEHAILDLKNGRFVWTDRAPTNPSRVNGEAVSGSRLLQSGDRLLCGRTALVFKVELTPEPEAEQP